MKEKKQKEFEIKPLGKWRRILLSLGDYFLTFIIAFTLFNIAVLPLARVICNTNKKNQEARQYEETATQLLIDKGIIFKSVDADPTFDNDVNYTFKVFLSYYAFDEENVDQKYTQYGHKSENEIIKHYYVTLKGDEAGFLETFKTVNEYGKNYKKQGFSFFEIGPNVNDVTLKSEYKSLLGNELLETEDESKYSKTMKQFRDNVFARLFYLNVYEDITKNDSVVEGYNDLLKKATKINNELQWVVVVSAIISPVLAWTFAYLIYPLINRDNRTPTMSIMKLDRLNINNLGPINKKIVLVQSFYGLLTSFSYLILLPILYFSVQYIFNLPILFVLSACSLAIILALFLTILFNQFNRSGSDVLTFTVVVPTSELDNLYKEKLDEGRLSSQRDDGE